MNSYEKVRIVEMAKELNNSEKCLNHFFDITIIYKDTSPVPSVTFLTETDCVFYLVLKRHLFLSRSRANKSPAIQQFIRCGE